MLTITNSFHGTEATIRAKVGDEVSRATLRRVWRKLCGVETCTCGREDGSRGSRYYLETQGCSTTDPVRVVEVG